MVNNNKYLLKQAGIIVGLFCLLLFSNCSGNQKILASVDDNKLNKETAELMINHLGYNTKDKKEWARFVNFWCEQQVFKEELKQKNKKIADLVEMRSQAFIGDLSKYYLEEIDYSSKIDTIVSEKQVKEYYNFHKDEFSLQDYIVKALYIKIPKEASIIKDLKTLFLLKNDKDLSKVDSYAKLYAEDFYFDDEQWIYFNELTKEVPINKINKDNLVLNRTKTYIEDDNFIYFINVIDFKLKNTSPPFDFLKNQIKEIIVAQRMNNVRILNESKLINTIKKKHEIKTYL